MLGVALVITPLGRAYEGLFPDYRVFASLLFANSVCSWHTDVVYFRETSRLPGLARPEKLLVAAFWNWVDLIFGTLTGVGCALNSIFNSYIETVVGVSIGLLGFHWLHQSYVGSRTADVAKCIVFRILWHSLPILYGLLLVVRGVLMLFIKLIRS